MRNVRGKQSTEGTNQITSQSSYHLQVRRGIQLSGPKECVQKVPQRKDTTQKHTSRRIKESINYGANQQY